MLFAWGQRFDRVGNPLSGIRPHDPRFEVGSVNTSIMSSHGCPRILRERIHRSTYRLLLMGAVLCPAYLKPIFHASRSSPYGFLSRIDEMNQNLGFRGNQDNNISAEDATFLDRFPIYDFEVSPEKLEPVYGDLARFLQDDLKTTAIPVDNAQLRPAGIPHGYIHRL